MDIGFESEGVYGDADMAEVRISAWNGAFWRRGPHLRWTRRLGDAALVLQSFPRTPAAAREVTFGTFDKHVAEGGVALRF